MMKLFRDRLASNGYFFIRHSSFTFSLSLLTSAAMAGLHQSRRFRKTADQIHALDGLAARALDQIVLGAHHDEPARARVEPPRDFDDVGAGDIFGVGQRVVF